MARRVGWTAALLAACSATSALAEGACDLRGDVDMSQAQALYDPFSAAGTVLELGVALTNRGSEPCRARLFLHPFNGDLSLLSGSDRLTYRIETANAQGGGNGAVDFGPITAFVPAGGKQVVPIRFVLPPQQVIPRGDYSSEFEVRLLTEGGDAVPLVGSASRLRVRVPARVEMSISGTSAAGLGRSGLSPPSIDFGQMQSGATGRVFVNIWSNGSVAVSLSSQNRGALKLVGNESLTPVTYSARFDGLPLQLETATTVQRTPPMSISGASYEFAVTLGEVRGRFAGHYQDLVTVSVVQN